MTLIHILFASIIIGQAEHAITFCHFHPVSFAVSSFRNLWYCQSSPDLRRLDGDFEEEH